MPEDLEKLFEEAQLPQEPQATLDPALTDTNAVANAVNDSENHGTHPKPCSSECSAGLPTRTCPTCFWPFCDNCASTLDKTYCKLCLVEPIIELKQLPLTDIDGVTHEGRVLVPTEPTYNKIRFGTLSKSISEMSDHELESHIDLYKHLIKQAETLLDTRRVIIGSMQIEKAQRADAARRALREDKRKYPVKTVAVGTDGKTKTSLASLMKMMEMMQKLEQIQKNKKATPNETK